MAEKNQFKIHCFLLQKNFGVHHDYWQKNAKAAINFMPTFQQVS